MAFRAKRASSLATARTSWDAHMATCTKSSKAIETTPSTTAPHAFQDTFGKAILASLRGSLRAAAAGATRLVSGAKHAAQRSTRAASFGP